MKFYVQLLLFGYHIVFQLPTSASAKLSNDNIAITKEVNVEVDMGTWLNERMSAERSTFSNRRRRRSLEDGRMEGLGKEEKE